MIDYRPLRIALLGAGSVGSQVARLILENKDELAARVGAELQLAGVQVRDNRLARATNIPQELFTTETGLLILGAELAM